ncbi:MAG: hypothetical protein FWG88_05025 [Oscillospiraceae bacterium]|nr:hypothetical protein [Oscillospiraceae bacterium]
MQDTFIDAREAYPPIATSPTAWMFTISTLLPWLASNPLGVTGSVSSSSLLESLNMNFI